MDGLSAPAGGDQERGSIILGVTWTLTLLSLLFVSLRTYTRVRLVQKVWWDDWLAIISIVSCKYPKAVILNSQWLMLQDMRFTTAYHLDLLRSRWRLPSRLLSQPPAAHTVGQTELDLPAVRYHGYWNLESFCGLFDSSVSIA